MKKLLFPIIIFFVILIFFSGFFWLYEAKYFVSKASLSQQSISVDNSYIFLTPLRAKANNGEKIRMTVFVLNSQGLGVMGKRVLPSRSDNLILEAVQPVTDSLGKAIFDISAAKVGEYYLEVKIEDVVLPQKAHLSFY
jgi:hypothetical protein